MSYDGWLEKPYQDRYEAEECPNCGDPLSEDKREREVWCEGCGYSAGFDWDAEAERRAEARYDDG